MREHVQVGIGAGLRRPIVQRLDTTPADVLLRFCAILRARRRGTGPMTDNPRGTVWRALRRRCLPNRQLRSRTRTSGCTSSPSGSANACAVAAARLNQAGNPLACRFGMTVHVQIHAMRTRSGDLPHTHFDEAGMSICPCSLCCALYAVRPWHTSVMERTWRRHGLIMVEFDVSEACLSLSAGCLSDLLPVCRRIRIAGTAHTKTCLPHDFREGTFR